MNKYMIHPWYRCCRQSVPDCCVKHICYRYDENWLCSIGLRVYYAHGATHAQIVGVLEIEMSEQEFDSSVSSVEDNVEADRNQEARGAAEQFSDDDGSRREGEEEQSETPAKAEHQAGAYKDSDEDNDSDGETIKAVTAAANKAATSYFSSDSEHGSPRERKHSAEPVVGTQEPAQDKAE